MAEIRSLLDLPDGTELPARADVEEKLTTGYAYALDLERRRLRLERSLRTLVRSEPRPGGDEVRELTVRLGRADQELAGVRAMLATLRAQVLS